jgi:hypothetical protein
MVAVATIQEGTYMMLIYISEPQKTAIPSLSGPLRRLIQKVVNIVSLWIKSSHSPILRNEDTVLSVTEFYEKLAKARDPIPLVLPTVCPRRYPSETCRVGSRRLPLAMLL